MPILGNRTTVERTPEKYFYMTSNSVSLSSLIKYISAEIMFQKSEIQFYLISTLVVKIQYLIKQNRN